MFHWSAGVGAAPGASGLRYRAGGVFEMMPMAPPLTTARGPQLIRRLIAEHNRALDVLAGVVLIGSASDIHEPRDNTFWRRRERIDTERDVIGDDGLVQPAGADEGQRSDRVIPAGPLPGVLLDGWLETGFRQTIADPID
jgi:hypothetical protein